MSQTRDRASRPHAGLSLTRTRPENDREADKRPLDFRLIVRLLGYLRPYAAKRNWLLLFVALRAIQLPLIAWATGAIINGPITQRWDGVWIVGSAVGFLALCGITQWCFHYRQRLALELGELVQRDLHAALFEHLQRMPMSYFHRTKVGRIISRMTSDCEALRIGVQDVLFVSLVGLGQMLVAALFMAFEDLVLFGIVLAMTPIVWGLNQLFRKRLGRAYRAVQESFSRVTSNLAESVNGIRVTQAFVRQPMTTSVDAEFLAAVRDAGDQRVEFVDPTTQQTYVVVPRDWYDRVMEVLRRDADRQAILQGLAEVNRGEGIPLEEARQTLRNRLGISGT